MTINWIRLVLAIWVGGFFVWRISQPQPTTDTEYIVYTMLFCCSMLLLGLAFETQPKSDDEQDEEQP